MSTTIKYLSHLSSVEMERQVSLSYHSHPYENDLQFTGSPLRKGDTRRSIVIILCCGTKRQNRSRIVFSKSRAAMHAATPHEKIIAKWKSAPLSPCERLTPSPLRIRWLHTGAQRTGKRALRGYLLGRTAGSLQPLCAPQKICCVRRRAPSPPSGPCEKALPKRLGLAKGQNSMPAEASWARSADLWSTHGSDVVTRGKLASEERKKSLMVCRNSNGSCKRKVVCQCLLGYLSTEKHAVLSSILGKPCLSAQATI